MHPIVVEKARNAPEQTKRFDGAGRLDLTHISRFPAELRRSIDD
jgi:hypothetical protein